MRVGTVFVDGKKVRQLRSRLGWTQEDLARKTGCSKRTIENVEAGRPVLLYTVNCVAQVLQIDQGELLRQSGNGMDDGQGARPSPFGWRTGITQGDAFFNRDKERNTLKKFIRDRQSCQIVGPRRIGKTSLMRQLEREASRWDQSVVVAYVDLQHPRCFTLAGWLEHAGRQFGLPATGLDLVKFSESINELMARGYQPVLCLDEFEELTHRRHEFTRDFYAALRSCGQKPMTIVTASQKRLIELLDASDPSSPFYNIFPVLELARFSDADAEDYVQVERPDLPRLTADERRRILAFAGGHPLALQVACAKVYEAKENGTPVGGAITAAAEEMRGYMPDWQ